MANERRVRENYRSGATTNDPLLFDDEIITSPEFVALRAVGADEHLPFTMDPTGEDGAPETIWIVAHTGGSDTVQALRGQEGSTARQHALGTAWAHDPLVSDVIVHCEVATRPGAALRWVGMMIDVEDIGRLERWNGTIFEPIHAYLPTGRVGITVRADQLVDSSLIAAEALRWSNLVVDTNGFQTAEDTITIPANYGGLYAVSMAVLHAADSGAEFYASMTITGPEAPTTYASGANNGAAPYAAGEHIAVPCIPLAAGHTIKGFVAHTDGADNHYTARLDVYRISG